MAPSKIAAPEVLIAGAGPTGLVLALWLARLGVPVRIIDKTSEPGTTSRALVIQARTLEFYRQVGLDTTIIAEGVRFSAANLWVRGRRIARVQLGAMGDGLSPFPYGVILPQDRHEQLLVDRLARQGVQVERRTELLGFDERHDGITARIRREGGPEEFCQVRYLAGCDGTHSITRELLNVSFPGGTYDRMFYVADVHLTGPVTNHELHVALDDADFLAVFPLKGEQVGRLVGTVLQSALEQQRPLTWDDVSQSVVKRLQLSIEQVNWFSTYHVHHRVAEHFRRGRAFLAGDAAHIHSPFGGQGMNTGIGDAVNLAWKLAAVLQGRASDQLLDSYEPERIAFARRLVSTTDRAFTFATEDGPIARRVRVDIVPWLVPLLLKSSALQHFLFRTVSQTAVTYRGAALNEGTAGSIEGGDRLPWVAPEGEAADNFAPLNSLDWQVHVYGDSPAALARVCEERSLPLHRFPWRPAMRRAGLAKNGAYLIRPDGYVALADSRASSTTLERYLDARQVRPLPAPPA